MLFAGRNHLFLLSKLHFFLFVTEKDEKKLVLTQKQMILTSKQHAEHPYAGQNTQHTQFGIVNVTLQHFFGIFKENSICEIRLFV